jgi:phosphate transport system substrate-binding protein
MIGILEARGEIAMMSNSRVAVMTGVVLLSLAASGCGGDDEPGAAGPGATGQGSGAAATIIVDGSSTVFRISKAAQEGFASVDPDVTVVVDNHGTGGGFSRYLQGEVDIVDASRNAKDDEESKARAQGIEWTRFFVGNDGITVVVNPGNAFVKSLSVEQLRKLWQPGSTVKTWKDLDPSWPDRKIILYSPDNDSGTFEFFTEAIVGKAKSQREGVQQSSDDNTLVNGVASDEDGIGYFGYAYYAANRERLRAIPVQNGPDAQPVLPSPESIAGKTYKPLSRPLFVFVKNSAARRPEVKQFLAYYLDNVDTLSVKAGYDPPTDDDRAANKAALAGLYPGAGAETAKSGPPAAAAK